MILDGQTLEVLVGPNIVDVGFAQRLARTFQTQPKATQIVGVFEGKRIVVERDGRHFRAFYDVPPSGLGTFIEKLVKPIAIALNLPCLDKNKNLRPKSPCAQRRDALNKLTS